jgi:hypothetical protein
VKAHLKECPSCRSSFSDLGTIHSVCFAQAPSFEVERAQDSENRLRNSVLRAASREGAQFSCHVRPQNNYEMPGRKPLGSVRTTRMWGTGAGFLVIIGCLVVGLVLRQSKITHGPKSPSVPLAVILPSTTETDSLADRHRRHEEILEQEVAALKAERSRIEHDLQLRNGENTELLQAASGMKEEIVTLTTELQATHATQVKAEEVLQRLKSERESDQSAIQAQNREIRSLNERLQEQSSQKERDQDVLAAETKLRELVGARNLHIVDVYDTDANGKTKKAVGRVFYTHGQSLVFYAYDLSTNRSDTGKYAYYVWGHKEGNDESVRNLGTLDPDDVSQKRWMLKVNDAKALSNIDRVFVTLEQNSKLDLHPHGKKILSAYLGSPANHP